MRFCSLYFVIQSIHTSYHSIMAWIWTYDERTVYNAYCLHIWLLYLFIIVLMIFTVDSRSPHSTHWRWRASNGILIFFLYLFTFPSTYNPNRVPGAPQNILNIWHTHIIPHSFNFTLIFPLKISTLYLFLCPLKINFELNPVPVT